jgi:hypothetical protein
MKIVAALILLSQLALVQCSNDIEVTGTGIFISNVIARAQYKSQAKVCNKGTTTKTLTYSNTKAYNNFGSLISDSTTTSAIKLAPGQCSNVCGSMRRTGLPTFRNRRGRWDDYIPANGATFNVAKAVWKATIDGVAYSGVELDLPVARNDRIC